MSNERPWTVIVVEDIYDDVELMSTILAYYGITVHAVSNGNECMHLLTTLRPTLIVTDLSMPGKDGWQTLKAIRADAGTLDIPVIAVTAYDSADVAEDARRAGFNGYFPKPINPLTFVDNLRAIINA